MPMVTSVQLGQQERTTRLLRAYQKRLARKPTELERTAMVRAATLSARAEAAALDPTVDTDLVVRLDNAAARARQHMDALIGAPVRVVRRSPHVSLKPMLAQIEALEAAVAKRDAEVP
jgi:hypothetical protein